METQHTPGPWTAKLGRVGDAEGYWNVVSPLENAIIHGYLYPDPEDEANAYLIAAAPELLAALKGLAGNAGLTWLPGFKVELNDSMARARAAIAKAQGGDQ